MLKNPAKPFGDAEPMRPNPAAAPEELDPGQGDHVFGDLKGTVKTALDAVIGGGQNFEARLLSFDRELFGLWDLFSKLDIGHADHELVMARRGRREKDRHAFSFGVCAKRFQFCFFGIVSLGFEQHPGISQSESRMIRSSVDPATWRAEVMQRFDDMLDLLVDSTALEAYLNSPRVVREAGSEVHEPLSLRDAHAIATQHRRGARVVAICARCLEARNILEVMLTRIAIPRYLVGEEWVTIPEP